MTPLSDRERHLLERLAREGKQTRLVLAEIETAKLLEMAGLVFIVRDTAVITPKGRHALAAPEPQPEPKRKPPFGFLE